MLFLSQPEKEAKLVTYISPNALSAGVAAMNSARKRRPIPWPPSFNIVAGYLALSGMVSPVPRADDRALINAVQKYIAEGEENA